MMNPFLRLKRATPIASKHWGLALLGLLCVSQAHGKSNQMVPTENGSGITISVSCDFDQPPASGAIPLHLSVTNNSNRTGTWTFTSHIRRYGSTASSLNTTLPVTVEAGTSRTVPMVASLVSKDSTYGGYFQVSVTGPGCNGSAQFPNMGGSYGGPYNGRTQFLGMSRDLAARSWAPLKKKIEDDKMNFNGTQFDPEDLGADWRGYAGIDCLAFSEPEWTKLGADVQAGIRQWVAFGGHLLVLRQENSSFRLVPGEDPQNYGFGDLREATWDGKEANALLFTSLIKSPAKNWNGAVDISWPLRADLGDLKPNEPLILGFVLFFALAIGPANLFYFAPASRRHRLFWTTPLLALGGSALLMVVILFQEGIGGRGTRFALIRLLPETHEELVFQEQISRTSLLMGSGFALGEDAFAQPIPLNEENSRQANQLEIEGRSYGGDWFRSRSIQGQRFAAIRPTRAAITVVGHDPGSGAPLVVSSIESSLDKLVIREKSGKVWAADNVRTGEKLALKRVSNGDPWQWWDQAIRPMSPGLRDLTNAPAMRTAQVSDPNGTFYASVSQPKKELLASLSSIRWKDSPVVYTGSVTDSSSTPTGASQP